MVNESKAMNICEEIKEEVVVSKVTELKDSNYIKPIRLHYTLNGKSLAWDCMKVHDSVAIVLLNTTRNKLVFVRQFRPAVYVAMHSQNPGSTDQLVSDLEQSRKSNEKIKNCGFTIELCAGIVDKKDKSNEEIAKEEILEETGYDVSVSSLKLISSYRSGVGISGSLQHLYFCPVSDKHRVNSGGGVEDEQIQVVELSIDDAKKLLYCEDKDAIYSRPAGLLFGLSWFMSQYWPTYSK